LLGIVDRPDLDALHACDNGGIGCVNPAHLWAGTAGDNMRDAYRKGRRLAQRKTTCPRGHPYSRRRDRGVKCRTCEAAKQRERYRKQRELHV
jgi:hypothetical protein